ncbi:hypothetical protein HUT19_02865 [Streptomyces sp. NA02950]|uniref:hypothetical protein n=1 Tax=Streptomyces sp. NA02950 TaxID=2742137 RepID=UPI00158FDCF9|nr:hypothetical protein [Streptomyces sp. NA02950]QKV90810.1 hypothetical protein HUT19_02865 [Streptomyces sp. NA02950]
MDDELPHALTPEECGELHRLLLRGGRVRTRLSPRTWPQGDRLTPRRDRRERRLVPAYRRGRLHLEG